MAPVKGRPFVQTCRSYRAEAGPRWTVPLAWSRRRTARHAVARSAAPVRYLLGLAATFEVVGNVHGRRIADLWHGRKASTHAQDPRRTCRRDCRGRRRRHAPDGDIQRRRRPARRLCRPRDLWQVPGASWRRRAQRADERRIAQSHRRSGLPKAGGLRVRRGRSPHRVSIEVRADRRSPADPHGLAAHPWRGPACREQAGCLAAARHLRRRAQRPRAGSERAGRHRGAALGVAQAARDVARGTVLRHHHDVRGKPDRRRAQGRRGQRPTEPPSTSARPRSSSTSWTFRGVT